MVRSRILQGQTYAAEIAEKVRLTRSSAIIEPNTLIIVQRLLCALGGKRILRFGHL
jgi:hypothetical protein